MCHRQIALHTIVLLISVPTITAGDSALGDFNTYGWSPENRASSVSYDDYMLLRVNQYKGYFSETIKLFPVTDTGDGTSVSGMGFKRYGE
jgi:hypothetical protein